ncbi:hypothetical protein Tco_0157884 [Tanacetum coccineum]
MTWTRKNSQWNHFSTVHATKPNGKGLRKSILSGPYVPSTILVQAVLLQNGRPSASTRHKGKEIAKPVTPQSESGSEEDSDPEQAQRDKDMQKNLALLAKYFKKLYKPTNNNL